MSSQRRTRKDMRNRMAGQPSTERERPSRASPVPRRGGGGGGDDELQAAIEASKRSAEEEARRHMGDNELEEALRLSREEDERRRRELAAGSGDGLFDEQKRSVRKLAVSGLPGDLTDSTCLQERPDRHGCAGAAAADADGMDVLQPVPGAAAGSDGRVHASAATPRVATAGKSSDSFLASRQQCHPVLTVTLPLALYSKRSSR